MFYNHVGKVTFFVDVVSLERPRGLDNVAVKKCAEELSPGHDPLM